MLDRFRVSKRKLDFMWFKTDVHVIALRAGWRLWARVQDPVDACVTYKFR
jgi:hypothetical protein